MEEDFLDPDYFVPYIRPEQLSPEAFQRISELSKLRIPRHFLRKYIKTHFHATISKAQLRNFKEGLYKALDRASREQLIRLAAPRLESKLSLWELLMLHCKAGGTPDAITALFLVEFLAFVKEVQDFLQRQLDHIDVESPSASAHDSLWRKHQTSAACADVGIGESPLFSRTQKTQWRPRSLHNSVRDKGGVSSTSQTNSVIRVTGGLVQIETAEQAAILGLPRGKYRMRLPPNFEKSHRTPPPTGSRMGFSSSTSHQPTSPLPPDITGSEVCVSNRSPAGGVGRSTPTTPLPLPSGSYLSTEPTTAENARLLSESFAPTTPPTVDHPLTSAQPIPQIDTASPATARRSTVFKHRFCLLPGLKKPLEIPSSKTYETDSTLPTNSQSAPFVPPDALTPLVLEFEEPSFGGVMASGPIDPPLSPSQSTSEQYTAVSEPSAWDPPTSDPASHPTTQSSLPDGDLVGPIPDEWISSGRFQPLIMDSGSPSQLLLESASGGVFHRTTGRLVFRVPPGSSPLLLSPPSTPTSTIPSSDVNKFSTDTTAAAVTAASSTPSLVVDSPIVTAAAAVTAASSTPSPVVNSPIVTAAAAAVAAAVTSASSTPSPVVDLPIVTAAAAAAAVTSASSTPAPVVDSPLVTAAKDSTTAPPTSSPEHPHKRRCTANSLSSCASNNLPPPPTNLESLNRPILQIERISAAHVIVTRVDGARFMVEDGGNGLTQATLEKILGLSA
nr:unnamed protein product [Spirometra erinaceieuropaei]